MVCSSNLHGLPLNPADPSFDAVCRLYIAQHPEVEAKILQELQDIGVYSDVKGTPSRRLTHADIPKLTYLQCVIKVCNARQKLSLSYIRCFAIAKHVIIRIHLLHLMASGISRSVIICRNVVFITFIWLWESSMCELTLTPAQKP